MSCVVDSVTRFGNLLDFGPLFKAFGSNLLAQISPILRQFLVTLGLPRMWETFIIECFIGLPKRLIVSLVNWRQLVCVQSVN